MKATKNIKKQGHSNSFDLEQLNRISDNDEEFTTHMINEFIALALECSEKMQGSVTLKDWEKIKTLAHKNIPSYSFMGLKKLAESLKYLEANALNETERDEVINTVKLITEENNKVIEEMREYLKTMANRKINAEIY